MFSRRVAENTKRTVQNRKNYKRRTQIENIFVLFVALCEEKLDSSFRSASFRMTFFACHSEGGTTEESQCLQL